MEVVAPSSVEESPIVTNVGVGVGDEALEGTKLVEISGRPVFVMTASVPVYRTLEPAVSGADVNRLPKTLTRLGYTPETDGTIGPATKDAVADFYAAGTTHPHLRHRRR